MFIEVKNLLIDLRDKCVNYVTIDISVVMKSHLLFETLSSNRRRLCRFHTGKTLQTDALKAGCINKHKLINIAHKKDIPLLKLIITETFYKIHGQ